MDRKLIDRYVAEAEDLGKSIAGLSKADLTAFPVPGTWSIQQIVIHMLDSDLVGTDRMKRVIAEDNPLLLGYDESKFAARLYYQDTDPKLACDVFCKNRQLTADILQRLPDETFQRTGIHTERGKESLAELVEIYADHLQHHLKFIREKRKLLGK